MPVPAFDPITRVIPPHAGDPRTPSDLSPFRCDFRELRDALGKTPERKLILNGLEKLRAELLGIGVEGFQWIDGSFTEDVELLEGRPPGDIDVVTFADPVADPQALAAALSLPNGLCDPVATKSKFSVDHFLVYMGSDPRHVVEQTRYWTGLFSHRRDGTWKGMLRLELLAGKTGPRSGAGS